jgi:hypothetical protein
VNNEKTLTEMWGFSFYKGIYNKTFIMKKITLTEKQLEEMVLKVLEEQGALTGAMTGVEAFNQLPDCKRKSDDELSGGVVMKVKTPQSRAAAVSQSFSKQINTTVSLFIQKDKKPFCKYR